MSSVDNGSTASYVYNALGERAERNVGGAYTEYLYDKDASEVGENNRTSWTETWAAFQGRHLFHFSGGSTYFTHMDSLGTTSIVTDYSTGAVVQDELHYPWGQEWAMLGTMQEERFAHLHHRDNETSLDPTLHRMYSSNEARWMTPDPMHGQARNPQSFNRYGYVTGNATNKTDPKGLCGCYGYGWGYGYDPFFGFAPIEDCGCDDPFGCDFGIVVLPPIIIFGGGGGAPGPTYTPPTPIDYVRRVHLPSTPSAARSAERLALRS